MPDKSFLAWPFFDEAHRRLKDLLDPWVLAEAAPHEHEERDIDPLCRQFVTRLGKAG